MSFSFALNQPLSREVLTLGDQTGEPSVLQHDRVRPAALADESERDAGAVDARLTRPQRGQAVGAVGPSVGLVADADAGAVEEVDHQRGLASFGRTPIHEVVCDRRPQPRERRAEQHQLVELGLFLRQAERRVIAGLLATLGIASGRLEMPVGIRTDPHVGPRRWYRQGGDAFERRRVHHA